MSQVEPLPFVETPASHTGTGPGALPEVRPAAPPGWGSASRWCSWSRSGSGVFAAWEMRTFGLEAYLFHNAARDASFAVRAGPASWDLPAPPGRTTGGWGTRSCVAASRRWMVRASTWSARRARTGARTDRKPRAVPALSREAAGGAHITDRGGRPAVRGRPAFARVRALRGRPAAVVEDAALHREPRAARRATPRATRPSNGIASPRRAPLGRRRGSDARPAAARSRRRSRSSATRPRASPARRARSCARCRRRACAPIARRGDDDARRQVVLDYLNTVPLSAAPGVRRGDRPRRRSAGVVRGGLRRMNERAHAADRARRRRPRRDRARLRPCSRCSSRSGAGPRLPARASRDELLAQTAPICRCSPTPA